MNKQKGLSPILIVLLITAIIGGYLIYSGKINLNKSQLTPVQTTQPSPSDETANWKTYSNLESNYSIKYPNILNYRTSNYQREDRKVNADIFSPVDQSYEITIISYSKEAIPSLEFNATTTNEKLINISGQKVKRKEGIEVVSEKGTVIHVGPIEHPDRNYLIIYTSGNNIAEENSLRTFDQMLSTFKFIQLISQECGVCGSEGMHNLEGRQCAQGLECKNQSQGVASSVYFCVKPGESIKNCLER